MTVMIARDPLDLRLLGEFQRDLPLVARPFAVIAEALATDEEDVLARLRRLSAQGAVSRVGAALRPNAVGASTLAAVAAPDALIEAVAAEMCAEPGVNHVYQREDRFTLWIVATGPDRAHVDATLARIEARTGMPVLDLPLVRAHHIDLGFSLTGAAERNSRRKTAAPAALDAADRRLLQALTDGLPLAARPFLALGASLGLDEAQTLARAAALDASGVIARLGVIVRHRALGWRSNAMVAFRVAAEEIDAAGERLAAAPGVTLCYQRRTTPGVWENGLFCMIHARSRDEAMTMLGAAVREAGLERADRRILFSTRCFKQTGALIAERPAA
jgi:DNA-binding Lrp family transcriptional regulator